MTEDREQMSDDRRQRIEGRGLRSEGRNQIIVRQFANFDTLGIDLTWGDENCLFS